MKLSKDDHWFRFEGLFGMPKPICWQGWAWYAINVLIIFSAVRLMIVSDKDLTSFALCVTGGSTIIFFMIACLKSNFLELVESLK